MSGFEPLSVEEERIASAIVDAAYRVHAALGPGLLERIYETCFCHELAKAGLDTKSQVEIDIAYDGVRLKAGLRLDVLVEDLVICELKSVEQLPPVFQAQVLSYLKLTKKRLGFLINFNVAVLKHGIRRIIL